MRQSRLAGFSPQWLETLLIRFDRSEVEVIPISRCWEMASTASACPAAFEGTSRSPKKTGRRAAEPAASLPRPFRAWSSASTTPRRGSPRKFSTGRRRCGCGCRKHAQVYAPVASPPRTRPITATAASITTAAKTNMNRNPVRSTIRPVIGGVTMAAAWVKT